MMKIKNININKHSPSQYVHKKYRGDNMPATVTIVKPDITGDEEIRILERISDVLEKIVAREYGINTKFTLKRTI